LGFDYRWRARLPLILVLISLLCLVLVPILVQRRTAELWTEVSDIADPARALVTEVQLALALEIASTRALLLTGDERYADDYKEARARRDLAFDRLLPLARDLGDRVHAGAVELRERLRSSDDRLAALYGGTISPGAYLSLLPRQQADFQAAIALAARLDDAIGQAAATRREEIRETQRLGFALTILLVLLALAAALLVARLGAGYRDLARDLDLRVRRQIALREIARELSASTSLQEAARTIAEGAIATTHASGAFVERAKAPGPEGDLEVAAVAGTGPSLGTRVPYRGSLTEAVSESGELNRVTEIETIGDSMAPYLQEACSDCPALVVPLTSYGKVLGSLVLLRGPREPPFSPEEVDHARILGDLGSSAIGRIALLEALAESDARFRQIAENIREFIWLSDLATGRALYVSPAFEGIWGRPRQSLYDDPRTFYDAIHPDDRARVEAEMPGLGGGAFDVEFRVVRPDGKVRWVRARGFPVRQANGKVFRVAGVAEDITERREAEFERERLLRREQSARAEAERREEELERVTESRARLIRGFTHDVKNPLGAADGYLQLLEEGIVDQLTGKQRDSVAKARRSIGSALRLIEDLLELARAEAGEVTISDEATDIREVARAAADAHRATAEAKGLDLKIDLPASLPPIRSDPIRIRQVLGNLLSNAVKYTDAGQVTVRVDLRDGLPAPGPGRWLAVAVADTGPGIPEDQQRFLFQEFRRVRPADDQKGAGIGLPISRRIAHALGGEITVESEIGKGSTFTLWLPLRTSHGTQAPGPKQAAA
jgi:PAS domain S-box-containing protein